ncbi:MAG: heparinase II/III family protein [Bacteroidota bacterium]
MSNESRRDFLNRTALVAAGLSLGSWKSLSHGLRHSPEGSVGLLFDETDLPRMRETVKHPRFAPYWRSLADADLDADMKFLREELKLTSHVYDMARARVILERTSFAYVISRDRKQLEVAKLAIEKILAYPKWDYFYEGGEFTIGLQRAPEATIAMAFALDWMGSELSAEMRSEMERQIGEKGAPACYRTLWGMLHPDRVRGWTLDINSDYRYRGTIDLSRWPIILNSTNLKVIPIAGLGIAGCLLAGKHPQADRWRDLAIQSARAFAPMFGSDGSYEEGVSYWGYTALHLALFAEVLHRKQGTDIRSLIDFPGSVRYGLQMSMPTIGKPRDCVNFGDASLVGDTSVAAWVARNHKDRISQFVVTQIGEISSHYSIVWFDPAVTPQTPGPELYDARFAIDWVVSRTGWDEASTVVAMRSGLPANHEHADRNSIILKTRGERLFHDPFKASYSYTEPDWLLRKTEAHSAILINGKGHQYHDGKEGTNSSWAEAHITKYKSNEGYMVTTSDASEAYRLVSPSVDHVRRTLVFVKPDVLIVHDDVKLKEPGSVQARFQIYNEDGKGKGSARKSGFSIGRPRASLAATVLSSGTPTIKVSKLDLPEKIGVFPFVEVENPTSTEHQIITVCSLGGPGAKGIDFKTKRDKDTWTISGKQGAKSFTVVLSPGKEVEVRQE